jgi:hypothetical protein
MRTGSCRCGSVRYEFSGEPLTCYACHCTDCQTASGSAFSLSMIVQRQDIQVTAGEVADNAYLLNGDERHRHHCRQCGTALWFSSAKMPEIVALKPGTLDDTAWFKPVAHLWVRSAQPWVLFAPDLPRFEKQPRLPELLELWQASRKS